MPDSRRRTLLKAAGSLAVVGALAGCAQDDDVIGEEEAIQADNETQQQAQQLGAFRVVHAAPDAPNVDVLFDDEVAFTDVAYGGATSYAEVQPGSYQVRVTAAGDRETVVYEEEVTVEAGQVSTAVVFGQVAGGPETGVQVRLLDDNLNDPGEEMARLRLFHAVPDAPPITVFVVAGPEAADGGQQNRTGRGPMAGGQPLVQPLAFGEYATVTAPAGDYTFGIVPAPHGQPLRPGDGPPSDTPMGPGNGPPGQPMGEPVSTFETTLEGGGVYSAFAIGYLTPEEADSEAAFEVLVLQDAMGGDRADGGSEGGGLFG